jgi:hypothetical protein
MASRDAKGALIAAILAAVALAVCCGGPLLLHLGK